MNSFKCMKCGDGNLSESEVDDKGLCLLCVRSALRSKIEHKVECKRCKTYLKPKFVENGVCIKCQNSALRQEIKTSSSKNNQEELLKEEMKKKIFLEKISLLRKNNYLRSDIFMQSVDDFDDFVRDDDLEDNFQVKRNPISVAIDKNSSLHSEVIPPTPCKDKKTKTGTKRPYFPVNDDISSDDSSLALSPQSLLNNKSVSSNDDSRIKLKAVSKRLSLTYYKGDKNYHPSQELSFDRGLENVRGITEEQFSALEKRIEQRKEEIKDDLVSLFGSLDKVVVEKRKGTNRYRYKIFCDHSMCQRYIEKFSEHLCRHDVEKEKARSAQSYYTSMYKYITLVRKHGVHPPVQCGNCNMFVTSLKEHLKESHRSLYISNDEKLLSDLERFKSHTNEIVYSKLKRKPLLSTFKTNFSLGLHDESVPKSSSSSCDLPSSKSDVSKNVPQGRVKDSFSIPLFCLNNDDCDSIFVGREKLQDFHYEQFRISKLNYSFFFNSSENALNAFSSWLYEANSHTKQQSVEIKKNLSTVWKLIDQDLTMLPNSYLDADSLEKKYFSPIFKVLKSNRNKSVENQEHCPKPSTIKNILNSVSKWLDFSVGRKIYLGIDKPSIDTLILRIEEFTKSIKLDTIQRKSAIKEWKASTLITPTETVAWGRSSHIQTVRQSLKYLKEKNDYTVDKIMACDIRNYLMTIICLTNATRCSNIINMTLDDVRNAQDSPSIDTAKEVRSTRYKTSMFYGDKILLFPLDIFDELVLYISLIRGQYVHPHNEYVFTSLGGTLTGDVATEMFPMKHNLVTKCISKSFEKSKALKENILASVSPSRIRTAVATEMVARQGINVDTLASSFMKHKSDTCKKYYLVNWSHREAARISMQCFNTFSYINETDRINKELQDKPLPKPDEVEKWYDGVCETLNELGCPMEKDEGLITCLKTQRGTKRSSEGELVVEASQTISTESSLAYERNIVETDESTSKSFSRLKPLETNDNQSPSFSHYPKRESIKKIKYEEENLSDEDDLDINFKIRRGLMSFNQKNPIDWYKSRDKSVDRVTLLSLAYLLDHYLKRNLSAPNRSDLLEHAKDLEAKGHFPLYHKVEHMPVQKLKSIKKWMSDKYHKDKDRRSYESFLNEAKEMIRNVKGIGS